MVSKLLKKALPAPLRPPIRAAVLLLIVPLRRRLRHTWRSGVNRRVRRRRNRLKRRVRGMRNRLRYLRRKLQGFLRNVWCRQLKQRLWLAIWRIDTWRRGNQPLESNNQIHLIIGSVWRLHGGNSLRTLHLFDELKDHADVHLWSTVRHSITPEVRERYPIKRIVPERFRFPKTGTFVFVGSFYPIGPWHRYTYPRRIVLVHNSDRVTPRQFHRKLRQLSKGGRREVEVVYASELTKRRVGNYPGFVQASLIDLDRFVPSASKPSNSASAGFTVGRLSMGTPRKHHPDD